MVHHNIHIAILFGIALWIHLRLQEVIASRDTGSITLRTQDAILDESERSSKLWCRVKSQRYIKKRSLIRHLKL